MSQLGAFLSHSTKDKPFVRKLGQHLGQHGINVWIDEAEIKVGQSLISTIADAIETVDFVIAVISLNSVGSTWVQKELQWAMTKELLSDRIVILPVVIDDCTIPFFLRDKLYADLREEREFERGAAAIVDAIKGQVSSHVKDEQAETRSSWSQTDFDPSQRVQASQSPGKATMPDQSDSWLLAAMHRSNVHSMFLIFIGPTFMILGFLLRRTPGFYLHGFFGVLAGCTCMLAGALNLISHINLGSAMNRDPNLFYKIDQIGPFQLPFGGGRWQRHWKLSELSKRYRYSLVLDRTTFMCLVLTIVFLSCMSTAFL